jgi:hypothetical protein
VGSSEICIEALARFRLSFLITRYNELIEEKVGDELCFRTKVLIQRVPSIRIVFATNGLRYMPTRDPENAFVTTSAAIPVLSKAASKPEKRFYELDSLRDMAALSSQSRNGQSL